MKPPFMAFSRKGFRASFTLLVFLIGNIQWSLYKHLKNFNDVFSCCSSKILTFILETVTQACHLTSTNWKQEILFSVFKLFILGSIGIYYWRIALHSKKKSIKDISLFSFSNNMVFLDVKSIFLMTNRFQP